MFGASDGVMPHRLAQGAAALEEERRVFHVAITRGIGRVAVLADASRPSPFLAELDHDATPDELAAAEKAARAGRARRLRHGPGPPRPGRQGPSARRLGARGRPGRAGPARLAQGAQRGRRRAGLCRAERSPPARHRRAPARQHPGLAACPGIGPAKLAAYGDELLALVAAATATGEPPDENGYPE